MTPVIIITVLVPFSRVLYRHFGFLVILLPVLLLLVLLLLLLIVIIIIIIIIIIIVLVLVIPTSLRCRSPIR
jgi:hypothetical protein